MSTTNGTSSFRVREWVEEDCEDIMNMIVGLAIYENMLEKVHISAENLKEDGFGPKPLFRCVVAEDLASSVEDGRRSLIGYAICFYKYSTFDGRCLYLEDIYVPEKQRKKGIGRALFKAVTQMAVKGGCQRIDFSVLAWNKSSIGFYEQLGAIDLTKREEWHSFRLLRKDMEKLAES